MNPVMPARESADRRPRQGEEGAEPQRISFADARREVQKAHEVLDGGPGQTADARKEKPAAKPTPESTEKFLRQRKVVEEIKLGKKEALKKYLK